MHDKEYFIQQAKRSGIKQRVVVCAPHDEATIDAINKAYCDGIVEVTLVGDKGLIEPAAKIANVDLSPFEIVDVSFIDEIVSTSVGLVAKGHGDVLMKGLVDTSTLLKETLKKQYGLRTKSLLSHAGVLFNKGGEQFHIFTDAAMNIAPTLEQKKDIIRNAVQLAHALGISEPKVANLCAKEKVYDKMPATIDAAALQQANITGEIEHCIVSGPLQLDVAVSKFAANLKGVDDPVAGNADIFLLPNIEVGNVFAKALQYMAGFSMAGVLLGARVPVVLVSRADGEAEKTISIALACAVAAFNTSDIPQPV